MSADVPDTDIDNNHSDVPIIILSDDTNQSKNVNNQKDCDNHSNKKLQTTAVDDIEKPNNKLNRIYTEKSNEKVIHEKAQSNENILSASNGDSSPIRTKKSFSLDKIDESAKKFISGDIIIDKENPFKKLNAKRRADFFSSAPNHISNGKAIPSTKSKLANEEFVTKEDVLKESKYVKTYIKRPDDYFVYDPTLKERLLREEQQELTNKQKDRQSQPNKKSTSSRISRITNERLKELKTKYSPSPLYNNQQKARPQVLTNGNLNGGHTVKFAKSTYKKPGDRSKYPDLSQIKVKTGTDLDGDYFNPQEVAINAKKFDARIKNTQFGSQDDLDEIAALTSDFDANGIDELDATTENNKNKINSDCKEKDDRSGSLTTTIRSKEFQKYLATKGLVLQPDKLNNNGIVLRIIEKGDKMASVPATPNDLDAKKNKKPSVLQRLFPNGFFSSRRRTTPKDTTPEPIKVQAVDQRRDGRLSSARRLVLHRQSMPAKCDAYQPAVKTNLKTCQSGSTSSISSTLTNGEHNEYAETPRGSKRLERKAKSVDSDGSKSLSGLRYIDSSSNSTIVTCDKGKTSADQVIVSKPTPKPRSHISGRSSAPLTCDNGQRIQTPIVKVPVPSQRTRTTDNHDATPKSRFSRPKLPISNLKSFVNNRVDTTRNEEKRVNGIDGIVKMVPSSANEKKRTTSKLPERLARFNVVNGQKPNNGEPDRQGVKTPDINKVLDQPKSTSTPIIESTQPKFVPKQFTANESALDVSPIPKPHEKKSNEIVEERQPHLQPLVIQAPHPTTYTIPYNRRIIEMQQPIYDRLPSQSRLHPQQQQPVYAQVDKSKPMNPTNAQFQRHAPHRQSLDQIIRPMPNQPIYYQQPVFVRQSPERNTISGVYRGNAVQHRISPQMQASPIHLIQQPHLQQQQMQQQQLHQQQFHQQQLQQQQMQQPHFQQQPPRPHSVLDEMLRSRDAQPSPSPSVQLRRKPPINRNEIMNQVIEFCRKSMNKTPTNRSVASMERIPGIGHIEATSSEVSPISYASVATTAKTSPSIASSRSGRMEPPGVPIRKQSLPQQAPMHQPNEQHPIYESIVRQRPPLQIIANEKSPLNGYVSHYAVPAKKFVVMNSEHVTPAHVKHYQQLNGHGSNSSINQPIYNNHTSKSSLDRIHLDTNNYDYIQRMQHTVDTMGNNLLQVYNPSPMMGGNRGSTPMGERKYGASVLPTIPQHRQMNGLNENSLPAGYTKTKILTPKPGSIVVVNDIEQMYRPIAVAPKNVRQRTSQASLDSIDSTGMRGRHLAVCNGKLSTLLK